MATPSNVSKSVSNNKTGTPVKENEMTENANTESKSETTENNAPVKDENVNPEVGENDDESEKVDALPDVALTVPSSFESLFEKVKDTFSSPKGSMIGGLFGLAYETAAKISDAHARLMTQKRELKTSDIITFASASDDRDVKIAYGNYESLRKKLEAAEAELIAKATPVIKAAQMSDEEYDAMEAERKENVGTFAAFLTSIGNVPDTFYANEDDKRVVKYIVENWTPAGMRKGSASVSNATSSGQIRPRLHGGEIFVGVKGGEVKKVGNIGKAAARIAELNAAPFSREDFIREWCVAGGTIFPDWQGIPVHKFIEWTSGNATIRIEKRPDPATVSDSAPATETASA